MAHRTAFRALALLTLPAFFAACSDDPVTTKTPLQIPASYDSTSYTANTTTEMGVRTALKNLSTEMKKGRVMGTTVSASTLASLYAPISSVTTPYYRDKVATYLAALAAGSGSSYDPKRPVDSNGSGGVYNGYLLTQHGLEMGESVEKGLFGAALYNHAASLMRGTVTAATIDQIVCIFGASPAFANSDITTSSPDAFAAAYAAKRDKNDTTNPGFYLSIKKALIKAQAAVKAGADYATERDEAFATVRSNWERSQMATVINYCYSAYNTFSSTNPTDSNLARALHAYGEAVGFLHGWRTLPQADRTITDAQIDEILTLLLAPSTGTPSSYRFVTEAFATTPNLTAAIDRLKTIYGFSDADLNDFKTNWVTSQNRR